MVTFQRKTVVIDSFAGKRKAPKKDAPPTILAIAQNTSDASVLVINASHEMAKEITLQLTLQMPGCSITYAPTVALAQLILKRKKIDLIVSSHILPDGPVTRLKETIFELTPPPDMVVVGQINVRSAENLSQLGYEHATIRKIRPAQNKLKPADTIIHRKKIDESVKSLGADIRNDLNNPLQEIVAMVFVAKAGGQSNAAEQALEAIEKAATNMAQVVRGLEEKIRGVVDYLPVGSNI